MYKLTCNHSSKGHVQTLAGFGNVKKLAKGPTTMYGAFVSRRLKEENEGKLSVPIYDVFDQLNNILGKEIGYMTTLPVFLKVHPELHAEFHMLSDEEKAALLSDYLQDKEEKQNTPKRLSNISLSKIIDFRIRHITSIVCLCSACCPTAVLTSL